MSSYNSKITGTPSVSYFVVELVDVHLTSTDDTTAVYFELRWGSFTAKSSTKRPVRGIVSMLERIRIAVPSLAQRRLPMELHMLAPNQLSPNVVAPVAWVQVPSQEVLAGKKVRKTFHMKAPDTEAGPTVYVLNAAFFVEDTLGTSSSRPSEIPYMGEDFGQPTTAITLPSSSRHTGAAAHAAAVQARAEERQAAAAALLREFADNKSVTSEQAANLVAQFAAGGLSAGGASALLASNMSDVASTASFAIRAAALPSAAAAAAAAATARRDVPMTTSATQTDLTGPVVSESVLTGARRPQVPRVMDDEEVVGRIRGGFDFPVWSVERDPADQVAQSRRDRERQAAAATPLRKPVDLLAMKNTVAAWPRDEVEGLIAYGEQMKRYCRQLEEQNARLVLGIMRNATSELVDMPSSVDAALSRSASRMLASAAPGMRSPSSAALLSGGRAGTPLRSASSPQYAQQQQQQQRSGSPPYSGGGGGANVALTEAQLSPGLQRILAGRSASELSGGADAFQQLATFEQFGKPDFLTRIEMSRGAPLSEEERRHVLRNFSDL